MKDTHTTIVITIDRSLSPSLGNIASAQFWDRIEQDEGETDERFLQRVGIALEFLRAKNNG